jgi:high-affinity iron transporter
MLTNTVVLFLRDLLPMFIMFAYLTSLHKGVFKNTSSIGILMISAILLSFVTLYFYENISDLFEGTGIEWLKTLLIIAGFICFLGAQIKYFFGLAHYLLVIGAVCLLIVHLNSFLLYFIIYFAYADLVFELLVACAIGTGICLSSYVLFSFFIDEMWSSKFKVIALLLWSLFVASQFGLISNYLHQIDVVTFGTGHLFNLSSYVQDELEYGFILKALTGFDATPSGFYALLLVLSFGLMFGLSIYYKEAFVAHSKQGGQD